MPHPSRTAFLLFIQRKEFLGYSMILWTACPREPATESSFSVLLSLLMKNNFLHHHLGFSTELDRVKNLPYCETETFEVRCDPQGANIPVGNKEVILPIKVWCVTGPTWPSRSQPRLLRTPRLCSPGDQKLGSEHPRQDIYH